MTNENEKPNTKPKKQKKLTRGERLQAAAQDVLDAAETLENALEELRDVRSEYEEWHGNLPDNLQNSALGEKLQTLIDIDLDQDVSTISDVAQEILDADLPLGFGRD